MIGIEDVKKIKEKKKVLISGAGVAGIVCAILLDKSKFEVELIERAENFRNIGFSIILWKTGFKILSKILADNKENLIEEIDYYKATEFILFGGEKLTKINTLDSNDYAFSFERRHLMEILERVLYKNFDRKNIYFKKAILEIKNLNDQVSVIFADKSEKTYDVVFISEGINSTTRKLLPIKQKIVTKPFSLMYAWIEGKTNLIKKGALFFAKGHLAVVHPPNFKNLFGFYFKKGLSTSEQYSFMSKALMKIHEGKNLKENLNFETSNVFSLNEVHLKTYFFERVVLLGDSAHGRPPTLGFGTSLALEDARILCDKINLLTNFSTQEIKRTFKEYSIQQNRRVKRVYRLQSFIHLLNSDNIFKFKVISYLLKKNLAKIIEKKVKKLADYKI